MISLCLIAFAAMLNAVMDTIKQHWHASIFKKLKGKPYLFFHKKGWLNSYIDRDPSKGVRKWKDIKIHPAFLDGWHLSKSIMILALCAAIVVYEKMLSPAIDIAILGIAWILVFNLFYNVVLKAKES